ncbi:PorT family protein [Flavisolibacter sp. BT320]|nr:PorT family protein [Flavisolibacter longurius]
MQYPNNDMDELFRKAAEAYPLNTGSANWEAVQAALAGEEKQDPRPKANLRWLFVVLPFLLLGLHLNKAIVTGRTRITSHETLPQNTVTSAVKEARSSKRSHPVPVSTSPADRGLHQQSSRKAMLHLPSFRLTTSQPNQQPTANKYADTEETMVFTPPLASASVTTDGSPTTENSALTDVNDNAAIIPADAQAVANKLLTDTTNRKSAEEDNSNKTKAPLSKKRFYVGIMGGPDMSTVKFERFSNVGFNAGILVGYSLNDRLAVEAGVLTSEKHYYSDGAHYKADGYYSPSYAKLIAVDGSCRMIEIPVALRYTFSRKKSHTWFATAGASSYIMQREDYNLDYLYPSSGNIATHKHTYTEKDKYWLAALQLSLGYSTKLGTLGNLRIEPYYALPLRGMGHGSLPVSSFGLRLGATFPQF